PIVVPHELLDLDGDVRVRLGELVRTLLIRRLLVRIPQEVPERNRVLRLDDVRHGEGCGHGRACRSGGGRELTSVHAISVCHDGFTPHIRDDTFWAGRSLPGTHIRARSSADTSFPRLREDGSMPGTTSHR